MLLDSGMVGSFDTIQRRAFMAGTPATAINLEAKELSPAVTGGAFFCFLRWNTGTPVVWQVFHRNLLI